jgi:hypothetical protein
MCLFATANSNFELEPVFSQHGGMAYTAKISLNAH